MDTLASNYLKEFVDVADLFSDKRFDLDYPELYERRNSEWVAVPHVFDDVYGLLSWYGGRASLSADIDTDLDGFVLVTCGWACPLDENGEVHGKPSEHPERRRMSLLYVAGCDGSLDAQLLFADGETANGMNGTGSLLDAMDTVGACVWKKEWVRGIFARYAEWRDSHDRAVAAGDDLDMKDETTTAEWFAGRVAHLMRVLGVPDDLITDNNAGMLSESHDN